MGRLTKAFLTISLLLLVCVSVEIIARDGANGLRSSISEEAHGGDVVNSFSLFHWSNLDLGLGFVFLTNISFLIGRANMDTLSKRS